MSRIILASFKGNLHTTVISYYSLINHDEEPGAEDFYQHPSALIFRLLKHNFHTIGWDFNATQHVNSNDVVYHCDSNGTSSSPIILICMFIFNCWHHKDTCEFGV